MQSFAVSLCLAILEKLLVKGSEAFDQYLALKEAIEKAAKYDEVVKKETTREERRHAEDDALS